MMADDTAAIIEQLGLGPVDVVGHSAGPNLALILARDHPKLVRQLVISGANLRGSWSELSPEEMQRRSQWSPEQLAEHVRVVADSSGTAMNFNPSVAGQSGFNSPLLDPRTIGSARPRREVHGYHRYRAVGKVHRLVLAIDVMSSARSSRMTLPAARPTATASSISCRHG
jgi:pimeloyl-ACP methyl ester carboxylesterase